MSRRPSALSVSLPAPLANGTVKALQSPTAPEAPAPTRRPSVSKLPTDISELDPDELFTKYTVAEVKFAQQRLRYSALHSQFHGSSLDAEPMLTRNKKNCGLWWGTCFRPASAKYWNNTQAQRALPRSAPSLHVHHRHCALFQTCHRSSSGNERCDTLARRASYAPTNLWSWRRRYVLLRLCGTHIR